jgi:hypothetical protein
MGALNLKIKIPKRKLKLQCKKTQKIDNFFLESFYEEKKAI